MNAHKCDCCTRRAVETFGPANLCDHCLKPFIFGVMIGCAAYSLRDRGADE